MWYTYTSRGSPSLPMPFTQVPAHVRPCILSPSSAGSGSVAATTSRGDTSTPRTSTGVGRHEVELLQRLEHVDELVAEAVLERHPLDVDPARDQDHLFVLDVDALAAAPMPSGNVKISGSLNGARRVPAALTLVDHGRVEALLDRRPDRERRGEVVAVDDEVGAVADADLVDPREQVVGRVAGGDVGEAGLDAHARRAPSGRGSSTPGARANWASPSRRPVFSYGLVGCGSDMCIAMST